VNLAYNRAIKEQSDKDNVIVNGFNKCKYFHVVGQLDSALIYAQNMVDLSLEYGHTTHLFHIYDIMSLIYEEQADFEKALEYHKLKSDIRTERSNRQSKENFDKMVQALELNYSDAEKKMNEEKLKRERVYMYSVSFLLLLSVVYAIPLFKSIKKKKELNQTLIEKTENLDASNNELREINDLKNKLFSVLAHDLRNPILSLSGYLDLLADDSLDPDATKVLLKKLRLQLKNTEELLSSIVLWAKSQVNGIKLTINQINFKELIDNEIKLTKDAAEYKSIELIKGRICEKTARTDGAIIRLILRNLLSNAIKFTSKGGQVSVGCDYTPSKGFYIWVKDTGIGMSKDQLNSMFTNQLKNKEGTNHEQGFGLGLLLCNDFAAKLGAQLLVESKAGLGSTFTIFIPSA
ncbi:MAG: sensor histidine kinase, partial [Bacteroidia bacterium]